MANEKNTTQPSNNNDSANKENEELKVHNPLKKDNDKEITQQDLENEQLFKEAQTERD